VCDVLDENGRRQEIEGDALVFTIPASTLSDVAITPALPEEQWRAITALRYGYATKAAVLTSGSLFGHSPARAFATDTHAGAFWDASEGQPAGGPVISFLAGGSASEALARRLRGGADLLLSDVCWVRRGDSIPRARAVASWQWERDPLARGGYAYLDPGFDSAWLPLLGRRAGRLFFAGEHTSENYQGYMEGALESAERVLRELGG
jgi:monoamine oxidase